MVTDTKQGTSYTVPAAPEGTKIIVRSRVLPEPDGRTELRLVEAGATGTYSPFTPLQYFTALDEHDRILGSWSPGYPSWGWEKAGDGLSIPVIEILCNLLWNAREGNAESSHKLARVKSGATVVTATA